MPGDLGTQRQAWHRSRAASSGLLISFAWGDGEDSTSLSSAVAEGREGLCQWLGVSFLLLCTSHLKGHS